MMKADTRKILFAITKTASKPNQNETKRNNQATNQQAERRLNTQKPRAAISFRTVPPDMYSAMMQTLVLRTLISLT